LKFEIRRFDSHANTFISEFCSQVFDYDWGLQDDFIGSTYLHMTRMDFDKYVTSLFESLFCCYNRHALDKI